VTAVQADPPLIFYSYARSDGHHLDTLDDYLAPLKREGRIKVCSDREISPGKNWDEEIEKLIDAARIVLFLVTYKFMASRYSWTKEVPRVLEREARREVIPVPVIVDDCDWKHSQLGIFQGLPRNGKPITNWPKPTNAWTAVAKEVRSLVNHL
jgi:hypothetical protein